MMKWSTMTQDWSMKLKVCVWFLVFLFYYFKSQLSYIDS